MTYDLCPKFCTSYGTNCQAHAAVGRITSLKLDFQTYTETLLYGLGMELRQRVLDIWL